ncbi:hypothetical protein GJ744_011459 [Endocarpon pusillum]|uniref:Uncharacterized protein n=1 Tax=Endocarpon pusillum TaxID=364733 RepID=A0A8H7AKF0_9EURO|nr:hypothetical protein GJ744_011459 [Endocarpon pusillum]
MTRKSNLHCPYTLPIPEEQRSYSDQVLLPGSSQFNVRPKHDQIHYLGISLEKA